ncbi:hypothetical protein R1sor_013925 [Riccia sorocarpa]|uniref:Uncharacterized protein n=1 Tax=Riccia sorocarpa TaxID=122646 RepID=A0ABD3H9W4_9MARC
MRLRLQFLVSGATVQNLIEDLNVVEALLFACWVSLLCIQKMLDRILNLIDDYLITVTKQEEEACAEKSDDNDLPFSDVEELDLAASEVSEDVFKNEQIPHSCGG